MRDFIQELKSNTVLSSQDINRLRTYIKNKYPHLDAKQQADILINSIRKIIDGCLKLIPVDKQSEIREDLLKNTLILKNESILLSDIFTTITSTYKEEPNALHITLDWVNLHLNQPIDKEDLLLYFPSIIDPITDNVEVCSDKQDTLKPHFQLSPPKILFYTLPLIMLLLFFVNHYYSSHVEAKEENIIVEIETPKVNHPHLPYYFTYKDINESKLKSYLKSRDSLLEEDPYFSSIINTAKEFDLNPLVLFAIAGHEQGFVPKSNPLSSKIINNPFNVFVSWEDYNTDIVDSSQIAARTVINLSKDRPDEIDPFQWINRKYAEDENWWKGVRSIFERLEREVKEFSPQEI